MNFLYYKGKRTKVSDVKQYEDKGIRFDYEKFKVDFHSSLIGNEENIKDSR